MRFAFWRSDEVSVPPPRPRSEPVADRSVMALGAGDLDFMAIGRALAAKRNWIIFPTLLVALLSIAAVNMITPRYKSEVRLLIDGRDNIFLRPNGERNDERSALDPEAVTSQVQLLLSRDLARDVILKNRLAELPEFDPVLRGFSPLRSLLALVGIGRDPVSLTPEERVLDAYYERFAAYAVDKSRVIVVEFQSRDPDLAASVANSIADGYLVLQQGARRDQAKSASLWLLGEIENLRKRVGDAESRVEDFRSRSGLFVGTNNTTLSNQQLGELNTQLSNARALKSDAEAKARLIREMLQTGKPIEASEVLNSELMRRLSEQRVTLRAQLAEQSSTLLDGHPRIKELKAQLADLERQIRDEASKISRSLDNDARIASGRVEDLSAGLDQLKRQASSTNGQDVELRALEREAKAQRDLLESYLAKYREANTRENIEAAPADGRIISRASVSNAPAYPKKLPIVLIATLATLMFSSGLIVTGELLRVTAPRAVTALSPAPPEASVHAVGEDTLANPVPNKPADEAPPIVPSPSIVSELAEAERLAEEMLAAGAEARKVTFLGTASGQSITLTVLTIARLIARRAKVVVVDLSATPQTISAASIDADAPGLAELMQGQASFTQVITKDRFSRLHLVSSGRSGSGRDILQSPWLGLAIDALLAAYDHVLLDAGSVSDLPAVLLTSQAQAVAVPDISMAADARNLMCDRLKAVGFRRVTMLSKPVLPSDSADPAPQVVAA
jgi:polysaccharide biosynthesis transport protein